MSVAEHHPERMEYSQVLDWLLDLETMGIKLGLNNITELLHRIGDPQESFQSVHVAGTNGKGSVSAMIASIMKEEGYITALYTSPHMIDFRERIQVQGELISQIALSKLAEEVKGHVEDMSLAHNESCPTFFEVTTALAFLYFAEKGVEQAVVEVGMGGRLDATNVIQPECSVITRIGLEHTKYLGDTLADIAGEKAGIIKKGIPVVTAELEAEALNVIQCVSRERGSPLVLVREGIDYTVESSTMDGTEVRLLGWGYKVHVPLIGSYQASNVGLAFAVVQALRKKGIEIGEGAINRGFANVKWPGRFEVVKRNPFMIFDATHTPQGAEIISRDLSRLFKGKIILVLGVLDDKDLDGIVKPFVSIADRSIATAPLSKRAFTPLDLEQVLIKYSRRVEREDSVVEAIRKALSYASKEDVIMVTGSIYTIGEAKAWWDSHEGC